jgi:hypothetical protein
VRFFCWGRHGDDIPRQEKDRKEGKDNNNDIYKTELFQRGINHFYCFNNLKITPFSLWFNTPLIIITPELRMSSALQKKTAVA